jgi:CheY-like chemotaxis protein
MRSPSDVLILEDDPAELAELAELVREGGLEPVCCRGPRQALARLEQRRPVLAIIDLNMARAPDPERRAGVPDVLRRLALRHVNCLTLVYSAAVETIDQQARIFRIHPRALFQSKRHGPEQLRHRIQGLLGSTFGDLALCQGLVVHLPSGRAVGHRVAVELLTARAANHSVLLNDSEARAARRFHRWLVQVGSAVMVRALGDRHYGLALREVPERDETRP